ncbi:hypothetical protein BJ166DRAFT_254232 [Pestalotiopsis sp. NC0098]|nr:hypothetical protein BJ166DRAFT_254232 [Pestalotiopsis sp. NC0098]
MTMHPSRTGFCHDDEKGRTRLARLDQDIRPYGTWTATELSSLNLPGHTSTVNTLVMCQFPHTNSIFMSSSLRASPRQRAAHLCGLIRAAGRSEDKVALFGSTNYYQGKHSFHISIHVVMLQATEGPSHRVHGYASHPKLPFAKKQSDRYCITVAHCPGHVNPKDSHPPQPNRNRCASGSQVDPADHCILHTDMQIHKRTAHSRGILTFYFSCQVGFASHQEPSIHT